MFTAALFLLLNLQVHSRCDSDFFQQSWVLLKDAQFGQSQREQAAFAVLTEEGRVEFRRWAPTNELRQTEYVGSLPTRAIALVHTHPNDPPTPSTVDDRTALHLGMPVYVLTRSSVTVTTGRRIRFVRSGDWNPDLCKR